MILVVGEQELEAPGAEERQVVERLAAQGPRRVAAGQAAGRRACGRSHGLQGPIDDAFMDSFIFVRPTGKAWHEQAGKWAAASWSGPIEHWRRHFRGRRTREGRHGRHARRHRSAEPRPLGRPRQQRRAQANRRQAADPLDARSRSTVGDDKFPSDKHALIAVYPNPLNPERYVVLNSSFTFRDYAYLNNARQVPMLPDWAVVDLTTPPNTVWPGKIAAADFFDERWQLKVSPERAR